MHALPFHVCPLLQVQLEYPQLLTPPPVVPYVHDDAFASLFVHAARCELPVQ
jgi:hypothetical protein